MSFSSPGAASAHYQRVRKGQQRAWRAAGLCSTCGRPAVLSARTGKPMSRCQRCRDSSTRASRAYLAKHREQCKRRERERRRRYTAQGLCQCGRPMAEGLRACKRCRARNAKSARRYSTAKRWRYRDAGLCLRCDRQTGINPVTKQHYRHCLHHRLEQARSAKARRAARRDAAHSVVDTR